MESVAGTVKQKVGSLFGSDLVQHEGATMHHEGMAEKAAAQNQAWSEGSKERVAGNSCLLYNIILS
jgi:uncharacterized protein YjbJ (UPF0337 family)